MNVQRVPGVVGLDVRGAEDGDAGDVRPGLVRIMAMVALVHLDVEVDAGGGGEAIVEGQPRVDHRVEGLERELQVEAAARVGVGDGEGEAAITLCRTLLVSIC